MATKDQNISASPTVVQLAGEDYLMHPLTDVDYGEFENWMRARPIQIARESMRRIPDLSEDEKNRLLDKAMQISSELSIGSPGATPYMSSLQGAGYLLWLGLRKHPGQEKLKHEDVVKLLLDDKTIENAMLQFDLVNGIPQPKKGGRQKRNSKLNDAVNSVIAKGFVGESIDSSPKNTTGTQEQSPT